MKRDVRWRDMKYENYNANVSSLLRVPHDCNSLLSQLSEKRTSEKKRKVFIVTAEKYAGNALTRATNTIA